MSNIFEGTHAEFAAMESYVSPNERAWLVWVKKVEAILGHSLDGDQERDGYSLDFANDAFHDGCSAEAYAAEVTTGILADPRGDDDPGCTNPGGHSFVSSGTEYGGDDESYFGEGRCYCEFCGADGDG
jgi:hypothetical protein